MAMGGALWVAAGELSARTAWARGVISQRWGGLEPFSDEIRLGAKAPLPRTFEKATAVAKRVPVDQLGRVDLDGLLYAAAERLNAVYLAQLGGRDVSPGDQDSEAIISIAQPLRRGRSQGRGLSGEERKVVELRAMKLAIQSLNEAGYTCRDTSATESFDLVASQAGKELKIEVKGTTSDLCDSILMTKNEVELHRREKGATGLVIVSRIRLVRDGGSVQAQGGDVEVLLGWDIDAWVSEPVAFQVRRTG